jgi:pyridoxal phosphate-dependent aminotransferase EpsN
MKLIPSIPLSYNPIEIDLLTQKLDEYASRHHDDLIDDFESAMRTEFQVNHAIALNSGTAALHLALKALEVGAGDIVIASSFTYVASVNPILYLGATPFFVDSSRDDWNMDPGLLEAAIDTCAKQGKLPKAILVVHTYGMPAKMNEILSIAARFAIPVLEDAAESIGSTHEGSFTGTLGKIGIFSFNNNKLMTTYGGGMLMTSDPVIAAKVNSWATQSRDNLPFYEHREIGYNYRMSPLNAAYGLVQLPTLVSRVRDRIHHFDFYQSNLKDIFAPDGFQTENSGGKSNRWITGVVLPELHKAETIRQALAKEGVETRLFWKPMHLQPVFKSCPFLENGVSQDLFDQGLCLPSGNDLTEENQNTVVCKVRQLLG